MPSIIINSSEDHIHTHTFPCDTKSDEFYLYFKVHQTTCVSATTQCYSIRHRLHDLKFIINWNIFFVDSTRRNYNEYKHTCLLSHTNFAISAHVLFFSLLQSTSLGFCVRSTLRDARSSAVVCDDYLQHIYDESKT